MAQSTCRLYSRMNLSTHGSRSGATFNVSAIAAKKQSSIKKKSKKLRRDWLVVFCMPITQFTLAKRRETNLSQLDLLQSYQLPMMPTRRTGKLN